MLEEGFIIQIPEEYKNNSFLVEDEDGKFYLKNKDVYIPLKLVNYGNSEIAEIKGHEGKFVVNDKIKYMLILAE